MRTIIRRFIIFLCLALSAALPHISNGSPVQARPACVDAPKAGVVELDPAGTPNALALVEFTNPFCNGPVVVVATVNNQNTAGERVGAQAFGGYGAAVSIQLDAPSEDTYEVYWMAMRGTQ